MRSWTLTNKKEIYAYLAVVIHMRITIESRITDYWEDLKGSGVEHTVKKYISQNRF